jgi:hypothetical protein
MQSSITASSLSLYFSLSHYTYTNLASRSQTIGLIHVVYLFLLLLMLFSFLTCCCCCCCCCCSIVAVALLLFFQFNCFSCFFFFFCGKQIINMNFHKNLMKLFELFSSCRTAMSRREKHLSLYVHSLFSIDTR